MILQMSCRHVVVDDESASWNWIQNCKRPICVLNSLVDDQQIE